MSSPPAVAGTETDVKEHGEPSGDTSEVKKKMQVAIRRYLNQKSMAKFSKLHNNRGRPSLVVFVEKGEDDSEIAILCNLNTPLETIQERVGKGFNYDSSGSVYFPLEKKYVFCSETGLAKEVNSLTLIDSQSLYERAFTLWADRAFQAKRKFMLKKMNDALNKIKYGTEEERAQAGERSIFP